MVTSQVRTETREDALVRLAAKAKADSIKLYQDPKDGRFYASSRSRPGTFHYLTGFSCTCAGFITHQRCSHLAALHSALGWLSLEDPDPTPPAETSPVNSTCTECQGTGTVPATIATGPRSWAYTNETCSACHGVGTINDAA